MDEVLLINPSANVFVFGDINVHYKDWLTYSGGTDGSVELCYNFPSQMTLLRWIVFLVRSMTVTLAVLLFLICLFLLMLVFVLQRLSLHWEIQIMLFSLTFHQSPKDAPFHGIAYGNFCADWDSLCDNLRDVPWEDIFKFSASVAASEFCEWVQVGIDEYILTVNVRVKTHSSL